MPGQSVCQFCAQEIPSDSLYCPHCGGAQEKPAPQPAVEIKPQTPSFTAPQPVYPIPTMAENKKTNTPLIIGLVIAGIVGVCCVGYIVMTILL